MFPLYVNLHEWNPPLFVKNLDVWVQWDRQPIEANIRQVRLVHDDSRTVSVEWFQLGRMSWFILYRRTYRSFEEVVAAAFN